MTTKPKNQQPAILPVLPGTISEADRELLREAGVVVIEHPEPHTLRILRPETEVSATDMLACAMKALRNSSGTSAEAQREAFTKHLADVVIATHGL